MASVPFSLYGPLRGFRNQRTFVSRCVYTCATKERGADTVTQSIDL
jgi:hypothetical protein